ncbi:hypothetical protein, partial [Mesorhizobium sp.]|uniref:hypothetical protein n=1 Tax=Mesorhizobium sp. TaxID=1871066 RepID=UPI00345CACE5
GARPARLPGAEDIDGGVRFHRSRAPIMMVQVPMIAAEAGSEKLASAATAAISAWLFLFLFLVIAGLCL